MANIFGEEPAQAEIVEEVAVVPRKRIVREYPGRAVETRVVRRKASAPKSRSKAKSSRHKAA
jgi:hypothetical protein